MTRDGGRGVLLFPQVWHSSSFQASKPPVEPLENKKREKKKARCSESRGRPWGRAPLSAFKATWGWCLIFPQGNVSVFGDGGKLQLNSHQQACTVDGALTLAASYLLYFHLLLTRKETAGFFVIISPPFKASKLDGKSKEWHWKQAKTGPNKQLGFHAFYITVMQHFPFSIIFTAAALPLSAA